MGGRALLLSLLLAAPALAADEAQHPRWLTRRVYADDGAFVHWPASAVGMTTFVVFGGAATLACTPFDLLRGLTVPDTYGTVADGCGTLVGQTVGNATYSLAGAPFWAMKYLAWDGPRALLRRAPADDPT